MTVAAAVAAQARERTEADSRRMQYAVTVVRAQRGGTASWLSTGAGLGKIKTNNNLTLHQ